MKHSRTTTAHQENPAAKKQALGRLKRIEGQVRGVASMVGSDRYCGDVLMQLSAITQSIRGVADVLLRNHLEHCVTDSLRSDDPRRAREMYDELMQLFSKYAR